MCGKLTVLLMQAVTQSGSGDIGGPVAWVLVALIWLASFVIATLTAYTGFGLLALRHPAAAPARTNARTADLPRAV